MPGKHVNTVSGRGIHAMKKETFWAEYVRASVNGKEIGYPEWVQLKKNENEWQLKPANYCGVELPSTGGPGTEYFVIIGLAMALGAAAALSRLLPVKRNGRTGCEMAPVLPLFLQTDLRRQS